MLSIPARPGISRRAALQVGSLGALGSSLPQLMQAQAKQPTTAKKKSIILIWLDGGPSQLETYDPKPEAPAEYRGPFGVAKTKTPGVAVSALMPETAKRFDKLALIRSVHHDTGDHFAAGHWMTTGRFGSTSINQAQKYPSVGSHIAKAHGPNNPGLPAYVGLPSAQTIYLFPGYMGAAYLGGAYNPFDVNQTERYLGANDTRPVRSPAWLSGTKNNLTSERARLLSQFDTMRRDVDKTGIADSMDQYQRQAVDLILGNKARAAFDIDKEDPRSADRYGTSAWARYTMMARRLVEAGVTFVTVDMPHWDDHSSIEKSHGMKVPVVDKAVSALLDDLEERGLRDDVLVVVMGEFGRTPRINTGQPGIPVPGRDHWGNAISVMMSGGGLKGGVVVGKTNSKAEYPVERALKPSHILATMYSVMGIDPKQTFKDHGGRPHPMLDDGEPIAEIC